MSHRYDDLIAWLNSDEELAKLTRETRWWKRPLTDGELAAILVAWLAATGALLVALKVVSW